MEDKKPAIIPSNSKEDESAYSYRKFLQAAGLHLDPVSMVLKTHLLAEYYIDQLIIVEVPRGDVLTNSRFTFFQKLEIVRSLDCVPARLLDSLSNLNKVRNNCSHSFSYIISESDVDRIGIPLGKEYLELRREHSKSTKELLHWTLAALMAPFCGFVERRQKRDKSDVPTSGEKDSG